MEFKEALEKILTEVKSNPNLLEDFKKDPAAAAKSILGDNLPDGLIEKATEMLKTEGSGLSKVLDTVEEKVCAEVGGEKLEGALDALKKLL